MHLKDFQPRGRRWLCHRGMKGVSMDAHYYSLQDGVYCSPHIALISTLKTLGIILWVFAHYLLTHNIKHRFTL